ncbi:MAG TPA: hypothetical protein PK404_02470 [Fervidobacterium sp.]|nr:hypothetical protein [Fervidobacterium sp.]
MNNKSSEIGVFYLKARVLILLRNRKSSYLRYTTVRLSIDKYCQENSPVI